MTLREYGDHINRARKTMGLKPATFDNLKSKDAHFLKETYERKLLHGNLPSVTQNDSQMKEEI